MSRVARPQRGRRDQPERDVLGGPEVSEQRDRVVHHPEPRPGRGPFPMVQPPPDLPGQAEPAVPPGGNPARGRRAVDIRALLPPELLGRFRCGMGGGEVDPDRAGFGALTAGVAARQRADRAPVVVDGHVHPASRTHVRLVNQGSGPPIPGLRACLAPSSRTDPVEQRPATRESVTAPELFGSSGGLASGLVSGTGSTSRAPRRLTSRAVLPARVASVQPRPARSAPARS